MLKSFGRIIGWLLMGLIGSVGVIAAMLLYVRTQVPINLRTGGSVYTSMWDQGYVAAEGTWKIEGQKQAFPLQYTELKCRHSEHMCTSATAEVAFGDTLSVNSDYYDIVSWTADTIILSTSALCVDYTYTISRSSQRVIGTRTPKKSGGSNCTSGIGTETLQLSLANGFQIQSELEQEARSRAQPFMWTGLALWWLFVASRLLRQNIGPALVRERVEPAL